MLFSRDRRQEDEMTNEALYKFLTDHGATRRSNNLKG